MPSDAEQKFRGLGYQTRMGMAASNCSTDRSAAELSRAFAMLCLQASPPGRGAHSQAPWGWRGGHFGKNCSRESCGIRHGCGGSELSFQERKKLYEMKGKFYRS